MGWTHESEHPVYIFDRSETPGEPLPMRSFAADFESLMALVAAGDRDGAARKARSSLMDGDLSTDAVALAVDFWRNVTTRWICSRIVATPIV